MLVMFREAISRSIDPLGRSPYEVVRGSRAQHDHLAPQAVKRLLEPKEVADAVLYLLGPNGSAVSGASLVMDYGWTAR